MNTNIAVNVLSGLFLVTLVFIAGWKVSNWRSDASKIAHYEEQLERMAQQVAERDRQMERALERMADFNAETQRRSHDTMEAVSGVAKSLGETKDAIVKTDMGQAGLTADADRLRLDAYRAATAAVHPASGPPDERDEAGSTAAAADPAGGATSRGAGPDTGEGVR